jgi:hypothetical protein
MNDSIDFSDLESPEDLDRATRKNDNREKFPCQHCGGTGKYRGIRVHQTESKCFACNGKGYFLTSPEARMRAKQKAAKKKQAKAAEIARQAAAYCEEHSELIAYLADTSSWNDFSQSLMESIAKRGGLTEGQEKAGYNAMAKHAVRQKQRAAEKAQKLADAPTLELTKIHELINTAKENGLKKPSLRVGKIQISLAPVTGKNAGFLYVKADGNYAGKISPEGKLMAVRSAPEGLNEELQGIAEDPKGKLSEHGRITGRCSCCGRELTNKESIEMGIGPICAENFGL